MIYPGFGTTYVVDLETEKNRNWKINTTVFVLETGLYYMLLPSRQFVLLTTPAGAGEANTGSNVGGGSGLIFKSKVGVNLGFKSLLAGAGIGITNNTDDITIASTASSPYVILPADVSAGATNGFQDITGFFQGVAIPNVYRIRLVLLYSVLFATTGLRISYTGPAMTRAAKMVQTPLNLAGSTSNLWTDSSSAADTGTASSDSMSVASNICVAEFIFMPSANGVIQFRFASEVSAVGSVTIHAGSTLQTW